MALLSKIQKAHEDASRGSKIEAWLSGQSEEDRQELLAAMVDADFSTALLHRVLLDEGCNVGESSVRRFREKTIREAINGESK